MNKQKLIKLWDDFNDHNKKVRYNDIYKVRITKEHKKKLGELFLSLNNEGSCLELGCGPGSMFDLIVQKIQPKELHAVDWSEKMLEDAKREVARLQQITKINFKLYSYDISKSLIWPDDIFDCAVANLIISYLTCGWKKALEELRRVIKSRGYLYIGTLLKEWSYSRVLWKHAPIEFILQPVRSLRGLKYKRIAAKIAEELKKHGAQFPSREELIDFIKELGSKEVKIVSTFWDGGLALRARI